MLTMSIWLVRDFIEVERHEVETGHGALLRAMAARLAEGAPPEVAARIKAEAAAMRPATLAKTWRAAELYIAGRHGVGGGDWIRGVCEDPAKYQRGE